MYSFRGIERWYDDLPVAAGSTTSKAQLTQIERIHKHIYHAD